MKNLSRADLLRVLQHHDGETNALLPSLLADHLGFGYQEKQEDKKNTQKDSGAKSSLNQNEELDEFPLQQMVAKNRYWYINVKEQIPESENIDNVQPHPLKIKQLEQKKIKLLNALPLNSLGEWQNLFDISLKQAQKSNKTDIYKSIKHLSKNKPADNLPKQKRCGFNKPICIIMERTQELRLVWSDIREIWQGIETLVGKKNLKGFVLSTGIKGKFEPIKGTPNCIEKLEPDTLIIYIGTFGALHSGDISINWEQHLQKIQRKGHKYQLYSFCPINNNTPVENIHQLDNRIQQPKALKQLVQSMQMVWLIHDRQLRYLREATEGATLHTELLAFNHLDIEKDSQFLWHKHSKFKRDDKNIKEIKKVVRDATKRWEHGRSDIAIEMEKLLGQMLSDSNKIDLESYPHLENLAAKAFTQHEQGQSKSINLTLLRSILPEIEILAKEPAGLIGWEAFMELAQTEAKLSGFTLPLGDKGLESTEMQYALLTQQHNQLNIVSVEGKTNPAQGLITLGNQAYCVETNKVITNILPLRESIRIKDQGFHYQLTSMSKPNWASRIWHSTNGLHAAHENGTEFKLIPATKKDQSATWLGTHNAWNWASNYGIDDYGLWADLKLNASTSMKMRWIVAATFMMGSPKEEKNREDNEIQHKVTLTKGYWLAETSVTQAQWQAVMGNNPSYSKNNVYPVNEVSWNDCQKFVDTLKQFIPDFKPRLPTESQWEYACRAGTQTAYWWGDEFDETKANKSDSLKAESNMEQNLFGLRSMSGNIWEWCNDGWADYSKQAVTDPEGGTDSGRRVLRGGGWIRGAQDLRSADRDADQPDYRFHYIGMRLAGGFDPQASSSDCMLTADRRA